MSAQQQQQQQLALQQKATSLQGEPWYREVVELRKQANDYKVSNSHFLLKPTAVQGLIYEFWTVGAYCDFTVKILV